MKTVKFFYNGIKCNGKFFKCGYTYHKSHICIYAHSYRDGLPLLNWEIENDSDSQTDYFEHDSVDVKPGHIFYPEILKAAIKSEQRALSQYIRRNEKKGFTHLDWVQDTITTLENKLSEMKSVLKNIEQEAK